MKATLAEYVRAQARVYEQIGSPWAVFLAGEIEALAAEVDDLSSPGLPLRDAEEFLCRRELARMGREDTLRGEGLAAGLATHHDPFL